MSLQRYVKNRERQKFFAMINSSWFESRNHNEVDEERLLENAPSTSKNEDIERPFEPVSQIPLLVGSLN